MTYRRSLSVDDEDASGISLHLRKAFVNQSRRFLPCPSLVCPKGYR